MPKVEDASMEPSLVATALDSTTPWGHLRVGNPRLSSLQETRGLMTGMRLVSYHVVQYAGAEHAANSQPVTATMLFASAGVER